MTEGGQKSFKVLAIIALMLLVLTIERGAATALASEEITAPSDGLAPLDLRVAESRLTGRFENRPLFEILDTIRSQTHFEYDGDERVLTHKLSGNFDGKPLLQAMETLLKLFNYIIILDQNGSIVRLEISSLRSELREGITSVAPTESEAIERNVDIIATAPGVQLTDEERFLFETQDYEVKPPPELFDLFEPWQDLASEETGPTIRIGFTVEQLPEYEVIETDLGPSDPEIIIEDLPAFEPFVSATGPSVDELDLWFQRRHI